MQPDDAIAIVGIGGMFPGALTLDQFWANVRDCVDATSDVPPGRWLIEPERAFDPRTAMADRVYSIRGGFIDRPQLDPHGLDLDRSDFERLDPVFHLALYVARQAWSDARTDRVDRRRAGVVFGNIVLPTETASALSRQVLGDAFEEALGLPARQPVATEPFNAFPAGLPAAVVARALRLHGAAYTIDAACGSSLYALKLAIDELRTGRADAMLCGGVSRPDPLYTQMGFSQLRALSVRGRAAPLDHDADGLVVAEGAGMFVLKRLEDALEHGDRIHGIVAGIGLSNDIQGDLLAPSSEGQLRAMRAAYEQAGWSPRDVDLVECHATGTPVGDAVEVESLKSLWGKRGWKEGQCAIGSVKSNIGHALTAAGAAGLLKVLLALAQETLPPTANFVQPSSKLGLAESPFRVLTRPELWPTRTATEPRRAAISAFGFGGINAHLLIEEWCPQRARTMPLAKSRPRSIRTRNAGAQPQSPIAIVGISAHFGPFDDNEAFGDRTLGYDRDTAPQSPCNWWGLPETLWIRQQGWEGRSFPGYYIDSVEFPVGRFRIPPTELGEMLPQQSLLLRVAADAIGEARSNVKDATRTGVLIGIGLDLNTTNYHLRWSMADQARAWNEALGLELSADLLTRWIDDLRRSAGPALTANRTMGSLGGLIASRVAREFKIGGPSFTVSCDETSGIQALAIAADWLRREKLDTAIVGAVDFAGDPRTSLARHQFRGGAIACDGAVALVLKRLADARKDGDRTYAIIDAIATSFGTADDGTTVEHGALEGEDFAQEIEGIEADLGHAGAATGLASVVKAVLCLHRQILPAGGTESGPRFWMRNRADGPRRARVRVSSLGGNNGHVVLEECVEARQTEGTLRPTRKSLGLFALEADDVPGLAGRIRELTDMAHEPSPRDIDSLARRWWQRHRNDSRLRYGRAIVAESVGTLLRLLDQSSDDLHTQEASASLVPTRLALVYPGLGNQFAGMGRELSALWPEVLRTQDAENDYLREQFDPCIWWDAELPQSFADHRAPILGSVSVGALVTDVLRGLGVVPDAAIGYSLGESAALVALGAWTDRDLLLRRLRSSPLFHTELAGPCHAARRLWEIPPTEPVDWVAGIVPRSAEAVREAIGRRSRVYVLVRNAAEETVVGGQRNAINELGKALRCPFVELPTVSTVHCEIGRSVEAEYRALHDLPTTPPCGIEFYSGAWGRCYAVDRQTAVDAIAAQATQSIDFPAVIERAYADGIRVFLEVGPGASCTRLVDQILGRRPHVAVSGCRPDRDPLAAILDVLAQLIVHRLPVDLAGLYGRRAGHDDAHEGTARLAQKSPQRTIRVSVRGRAFDVPAPPAPPKTPTTAIALDIEPESDGAPTPPFGLPIGSGLSRAFRDAERATAEAHEAFLRVAQGAADLISKQIAFQLDLIDMDRNGTGPDARPDAMKAPMPRVEVLTRSGSSEVLLDRTKCLEFAVGSIGAVLGPDFAAADRFPTRVRLPDLPLMLVDRILSVEGQPRSLQSGRVVTEHEIESGAWYLEGGRIAPCIAIEAGQADLFLCGYLGVDFETRGLAVYRLLDATVTFHRALPAAGEVIRYDIRITKFFRQGKTILFRFQFEATVGGKPLLTMRDGCAGFFTPEELAAGRGIVPRDLDVKMHPGPAAANLASVVPVSRTRLDEQKIAALRCGDLATAFGPPFDRLAVRDPLSLPGGRMALVHRVVDLDPVGGPSALGFVRAETDIHPGDWFMVCHFVDDRVMPGTLMYESCLHALRILLMRNGWVGSRGEVAFEPIPGIANRLKCRGQIVESTRVVTYEVTVKERSYRPEPYAIADALILADGKPIVEVTDLALQLSGSGGLELERLWACCLFADRALPAPGATDRAAAGAADTPAVVFDHDRIIAFAIGKPSDAFGEAYRVFDQGRFLARLPGPPYQFLDRITRIEAEPWVMAAGGSAEAQFDIVPDAWYFLADRQDRMPFAVLLEVGLQACGWMAAYMGSALTSDGDLKFRNLGGTARQYRPVMRDTGTLTTQFRVTKIARTAGMILQHYDFVISCRDGLVYDGDAEFGFFQPSALLQQVGIRDAAPYQLTAQERACAQSFVFPTGAPFPDSRWRMIDQIDALVLEGGPHGLGVVQGSTGVDPDAWFFKAHFRDDPVWPGSLGLESLLQLLKIVVAKRWDAGARSVFESPAIGQSHHWTYRGQIVPANDRVTVSATIKVCDDRALLLVADGHLVVDGKVIYQMNDFSLRLAGD